jgi:hypothetical protein
MAFITRLVGGLASLALVTTLMAGCASTSIVDSWSDPSYQGGPFKRIMVLGVTKNAVARRTFEDIFAAKLRANGTDAVPSYQYLPQDGVAGEPELDSALKASGADGLLMVRLLRVEQETRVTTNYAPMTFAGYYGYYTAWGAYPDVYQYDVATCEVNLFDVKTNKLVWGGTTQTFNPKSVRKESAGFADVVIAALAKRGLVPAS